MVLRIMILSRQKKEISTRCKICMKYIVRQIMFSTAFHHGIISRSETRICSLLLFQLEIGHDSTSKGNVVSLSKIKEKHNKGGPCQTRNFVVLVEIVEKRGFYTSFSFRLYICSFSYFYTSLTPLHDRVAYIPHKTN